VQPRRIAEQALANILTPLPMVREALLLSSELHTDHGDPFDRLLLALARHGGFPLLSIYRQLQALGAVVLRPRGHLQGLWQPLAERRFAVPRHFASFDDFEQRAMRPTFADHGLTDAMVEQVRALFVPHLGADGARFEQPMHVRLLRKTA
jgi:hypothetical protein